MLGNAAAIEAVAAGLVRHGARNVVLDPVMAATSGERLLRADALDALLKLIPRASVVTPNLPEAAALLGVPAARDESEMLAQGQKLLELGAAAVLIKGGHGSGPDSVDLLVETAGSTRFSAPRVRTENSHGTGCTLASAIAAGLAKGLPLGEAVGEAKTYIGKRHRRGGPARHRLRPRPAASFLQVVVGSVIPARPGGSEDPALDFPLTRE